MCTSEVRGLEHIHGRGRTGGIGGSASDPGPQSWKLSPQPQKTRSSRRVGTDDFSLLATTAPMATGNWAAVVAGSMTLVLPATVAPRAAGL